ncbi:DinB family protein, partial [Clostridium perfringens]
MLSFCTYALHQIEVAIVSIVAIIDKLDEADLLVKPTEGKYSVGELLKHIAVICRADFHISGGATQEEMSTYYASVSINNLKELQAELLSSYSYLEQALREMTEEE